MQIRAATSQDIPAINRLYCELDADAIAFQPEHFVRAERSDDYFISIFENPQADFLVITTEGSSPDSESDDRKRQEGEVVGFSLILEKETPTISCLKKCRYAYVQDFVVASGHRNQGLGAALLAASKDWARTRGLAYLRLSVFPQNAGAIRFYTRQGLAPNMLSMEGKLDYGAD